MIGRSQWLEEKEEDQLIIGATMYADGVLHPFSLHALLRRTQRER